ncbi:hypothetical protein J2Z21_003355 [Streptomyces griseochromogenes]|uniref:Uncharacterized protein n=1 Tax=Streptomyces griseochromogenes TaxID=68214 RepID=A0ABS4LTD7_9ACTN|nr:hypothetical protein [Streptomyces griseochromogenes]MBP2050416.1 hypothetical protein [Streptomyces griseochromogenes]
MIAAVAAGGLSAVGVGAGTAYAHDGGLRVTDLYRPFQECSPQTVAENNLPIGVLGLGENMDTTCGQFNNAFTG